MRSVTLLLLTTALLSCHPPERSSSDLRPSPPPLPSYSGPCDLPPEPFVQDFAAGEWGPGLAYEEPPLYPRLAEQAGIGGRVWLSVLVDCWGKVVQARVGKSSGTEALDQAALDAAKKCRFHPVEGPNGPIAVWTTLHYDFEP